MSTVEENQLKNDRSHVAPPRTDAVTAEAPSRDASQQPGFKVVDEGPSNPGSKLVWTALVVAIVILAGYYFGFYR